MIGIMLGDFIGSTYEKPMYNGKKFKVKYDVMYNFPKGSKFTDDTYLTFALIEALLTKKPFYLCLKEWAIAYPKAGYGGLFAKWVASSNKTYKSFGNGAAVRSIILGQIYGKKFKETEDLSLVEELIQKVDSYSSVTHGYYEALKAARFTALLAAHFVSSLDETSPFVNFVHYFFQQQYPKIYDEYLKMKKEKSPEYFYGMGETQFFTAKAYPSVPHAVLPVLDCSNIIFNIVDAINIHNDPDTQAAIAGGLSENYANGFYGGVSKIKEELKNHFDRKMIFWYEKFVKEYNLP